MRRPGLLLALCFAAGIWLADRWSLPLVGAWSLAWLLWLVSWVWSAIRPWVLPFLLAAVGGLHLVQRAEPLAPEDLRHVVAHRVPVLAVVHGTLQDSPGLRMRVRDGAASVRTVARLEVHAIQLRGEWVPARGRVIVSTAGDLVGAFYAGQAVQVRGMLNRPAASVAPGLFDYAAWLRRRGIYYQLRVESAADWELIGPRVSMPWTDRFVAWATRQLERGLPSDETVGLLRAMTLGLRTALTDEVSEAFMRSGTMHVFAISGLHIGLLSGILLTLFQVLRLPRAGAACSAIVLIWFYTAATGWQPSAVRATVMMTVVALGWVLGRPGDLLNSLGWAGLLILVWEPEQLFHAGFQLSFAVVASLALWMPKVEAWVHRQLRLDPHVPPELVPGWRRLWVSGLRVVALAAGTSWAAWVGSLPLIAWYFHLVTPVTLLANVVVVPCAALALISCLASWSSGLWWSGLGELFNQSAWLWMSLMHRLSEWAAQMPYGSWFVTRPAAWEVAAYYVWCVWALAGGWSCWTTRWLWIVTGVIGLVVAGVVRWRDARDSQLVLLPGREAPVAWIQTSERQSPWLLNCGAEEDVEFVVKPFLRAAGVDRLRTVGISQALAGYAGGLPELVVAFKPSLVGVGEAQIRSRVIRDALAFCEREKVTVRRLGRGDGFGGWEVLHPGRGDRFTRAADAALVLRGNLQGLQVLWVGGLGRDGLQQLLSREPALKADVLVLAGPDLEGAALQTLLERVRPAWIWLADGLPGQATRGLDAMRDCLHRAGIPFWCTSQTGAIVARVRGQRWTIRTASGWEWQGLIPMAGEQRRRS
ncbi:MAG: ComEC/Rec2 family competence protein [Verrucomicrobiota bacterium]|nr:ComEC/Rec2 family competence protein [Limisphaera sp.]MDW8382340.1 ComEC/Rec2 family competence protein [Verrucomicrobiota bacterium]